MRRVHAFLSGRVQGVWFRASTQNEAQRLGLTDLADAEKIAAELEDLVSQDEWIAFSTRTILHGRRVCSARSPRCEDCVLEEVCPRIGV